MEYMSNFDFYEVRFGSILSDSDRKVLIDLYQPLVGAGAIALFFKLWSDCENDKETGFYSIDKLLTNMKITGQDLISQRKHLEALGLLKTYEKKIDDGKSTYMFCLYAPKQPSEFFDDPFFSGLLTKYIGKKDVQRLVLLYKTKIDTNGYKDITSTFGDVFSNDMTSLSFNDSIDASQIIGRNSLKINTNFDSKNFINLLVKEYNVKEDFLSDEEIEKIAKMALIYGYDEKVVAEYFNSYCDYCAKKGSRIKFDKLDITFKNLLCYPEYDMKNFMLFTRKSEKITTNGKYSKLITLMEEMPPALFIKYIQNNIPPSDSDLLTIKILSKKYKLKNCVINALISYVLDKNHNVLSRALTEKIAGALVREGVSTAVETMNYLYRFDKDTKERIKSESSYTPRKAKKYFDDEEEEVEFNPDLEDENVDD